MIGNLFTHWSHYLIAILILILGILGYNYTKYGSVLPPKKTTTKPEKSPIVKEEKEEEYVNENEEIIVIPEQEFQEIEKTMSGQ